MGHCPFPLRSGKVGKTRGKVRKLVNNSNIFLIIWEEGDREGVSGVICPAKTPNSPT